MTLKTGDLLSESTKQVDAKITETDVIRQFEQRLEQYPGLCFDWKDPTRYDGFPVESLAMFCRMKDRSNNMFLQRVAAAQEVIDLLARKVGIDPEKCGLLLYTLDPDGSSPIADKMDDYFSRSGEKAKLKKRIDELENENRILRTLIQK